MAARREEMLAAAKRFALLGTEVPQLKLHRGQIQLLLVTELPPLAQSPFQYLEHLLEMEVLQLAYRQAQAERDQLLLVMLEIPAEAKLLPSGAIPQQADQIV
jgi:hypothetical protein